MKLPPFEKDLSLASTLPASLYVEPEVLALERDRIFARTWQPVGNLVDLAEPGAFVTADVAGEPVVVTRTLEGDLRAFYNVCRHRAGPLAEGKGRRKLLTCRYHGWTYALDGKLLKTPEFEGVKNFDPACSGLVPVRVETFGPWVFVNLDAHAEPLARVLGEIVDETAPFDLTAFRPVARRDYDIACNWKVYVDNYLEGFHIPYIHAGLNATLDYGDYRVELLPGATLQLGTSKSKEGCFDIPAGHPDHGTNIAAYYYWIFPNTMVNVYPWGISINVVRPLAPNLTKVSFLPYVWDETKRGSGAGADLDRVEREDEAVVNLVQKGMRSRFYARGRYSPAREDGTHHFHRLISDYFSSE